MAQVETERRGPHSLAPETGPGVARRVLAGARPALLVLACVAGLVPDAGSAQSDSVVVRAGPRYEADGLRAWFLGEGYRRVWATPVGVEVLDLARFAEGLEPIEPGGGRQTRTLHLRGADGRRYIFRSVDKYAELVLPPDLRRTFVQELFQDHMSALHPTGARAVPALLDAAGLLHVRPRLVVMPDDRRLGEYRAEFAGMLGQIEERPDEGPDGAPGFAGSSHVVDMEGLLERLDEDPAQVIAAEEYLAARLVDFLIGDTDRGPDQWRWAGEDRKPDGLLFRPIPRDRDWAFVRSDALLSPLARAVFPKLVAYGPGYPSVRALTYSSIDEDRQLLSGIDREAWDSVAGALQAALTDEVIADALAAMPPEHRMLEEERLATALLSRRDRLPGIAGQFYHWLAGEVDVRATDEADVAVADVLPDGSVDVRVAAAATPASPYFERRFRPDDTREVRLYLLGGDDRAVVQGTGRTTIVVRVIGGPGDDRLADSSVTAPGTVALYDAEGEDEMIGRAGTRVDREPFDPPEPGAGWFARMVARDRFRDWGRGGAVGPVVEYGEGAGVILGAGITRTRFGFRRVPHARSLWLEATYALRSGGFGVEAGWDRPWESSPWSASIVFDAEQYDAIRFYGFGNDTPEPAGERDHRDALVMQDRAWLTTALTVRTSADSRISLGLRGKIVDARPVADGPLAVSRALGHDGYETAAGWIDAELQSGAMDGPQGTAAGVRIGGAVHPPLGGASDWFGAAEAEARASLDIGPTLAFRAGGRKAWGPFPVQEAAFLGGKGTLRGFRFQRFAGDGALYGAAEARAPLGRVLLLVRGDLGAMAFADVGRVFVDGASPEGWHRGFGGGLTFTSLGLTFAATYARGEEDRFYLDLGLPF